MYMDKVEDLRFMFVALVQDRLLATDRPRSTAHAEGEVKCTKVGIGFSRRFQLRISRLLRTSSTWIRKVIDDCMG
jgi:hypothetical protein